jgi:uncharacterized protein (DUF2384 family)
MVRKRKDIIAKLPEARRGRILARAAEFSGEVDTPAVLAYAAPSLPIDAMNRETDAEAVLSSDEGDPILGLANLAAQVEAMVKGVDGAEGFDAMAWTSRWLGEPLPALGGVAPSNYMGTREGRALVSETLARIQSGAYG